MVWGMPNAMYNYMYNLENVVHDAESENKLPRLKQSVRSLAT